ncbi:hypothetical protein G3N88_19750, partial [Xanthomonas hortorum pv. gardneri]
MTDLLDAPPPALDGIHVGIGGLGYAPRGGGLVYSQGVVQPRGAEDGSRHGPAVGNHRTFFGAPKPAADAKWRGGGTLGRVCV